MIDWIQFGQVAAERDALLKEYFFDSGVLERVIGSDYHFLVLGRKGAGKTAVFRQFDDDYEKYLLARDCSIALSLNNYDWAIHELLSNPQKAPALSFIESWKYYILVSAVLALEASDFSSSHTKKMKKILDRIYGSPAPSFSEVVGKRLLQLSRLKLPSAGMSFDEGDFSGLEANGGEVEFSSIKADQGLASILTDNISNLVRFLESGLEAHFRQELGRVFVVFDRIDEAWVVGNVSQIRLMISGLVGAGEAVTQKFVGRLRPIIFLREDIFSELDINDRNKLRSDCGQLLAWQAQSLNRMIIERVNYFAKTRGLADFSDVNDLFDKDKMRQQRKPFDYLLLRTMMRPRDLIKFLDLVREEMIGRRGNPFEKEEVSESHLECEAIYNVEPSYSAWLREEIIDEWGSQLPEIRKILDALSMIGSTVFTSSEFAESLGKIGLDSSPMSVMERLRFLFDNSIIGFKVGKSQQWRFKCFMQTQGFIDSEQYKVHDGLIRALNLKEPRSTEGEQI